MFERANFTFLILCALTVLTGCRGSDVSTEEYRTLLSISQVKAYYYSEPKTHTKYPLVQGSLANLGAKDLIVVEFLLRFKNNLEKVICEEHAYPVFVSRFAHADANQSLRPGQSTRFAFKAPKCSSTWQPGGVDIEITKIVFAKTG